MIDIDYDIAVILNYYSPYVSGLTETARLVAEGLVRRGQKVAVVTTQHHPDLPLYEVVNGVSVYRAPVVMKIGRGPISPTFLSLIKRVASRSRSIHLHLPMLEAIAIPYLAKNIPIVSTYHIDLWLKPSVFNKIQILGVNFSARAVLKRSTHIVVNSDDQAHYSVMWPIIQKKSWSSIPAPCLDPRGGKASFRIGSGYHIGFMGRIVPDKGIQYLVKAFQKIAAKGDRLILAGEYDMVAGGSNIKELRELIGIDPRIEFVGLLDRDGTRDFYASIDVFALTSVAESFGIVQAEAMMCGLPVVGSDLPGGRIPILQTGFGKLTQPRNVEEISQALLELKNFPEQQKENLSAQARDLYGLESCIDRYEQLFNSLNETVRPHNEFLAALTNQVHLTQN